MRRSCTLGCVVLGALVAAGGVGARADTNGGPEWAAFNKIAGSFSTAEFDVASRIVAADAEHYSVIRVKFRKPNFARCEVIDGEGAGGIAVWRGGSKVLVRPPGLLSRFTLALDRSDPHVVDTRGRGCGQITLGNFASEFSAGGTIDEIPGPSIDGNATDEIVWTRDGAGTGDSKRRLYISKATHLPLELKGYRGTTLVEDSTYRNIHIDVPLPYDTFQL